MTGTFEAHRRLLFAVAYNLLGSAADAEDVVQETWLRWSGVDHDAVHDPRAYLVQIATRQALNRIRANKARRESYVGPWLPEPLLAGAEPAPKDPAEQVVDEVARGEAVSLAMLVVLETLSPLERAVFVLREVFGMSHDEVAGALGRSAAGVRQLAHRAREHVQARRPRFDTDRSEQRRVTEAFVRATATGDLDGLLSLLAPDVVLVTDGGGKRKAALRPILGAEKVARFLLAVRDKAAGELSFATVNGEVGVAAREGGAVTYVGLVEVADGRITHVLAVMNPDKLAHLVAG
jgi:RNA polymerase sigma-70 factor (ECF subfamily)